MGLATAMALSAAAQGAQGVLIKQRAKELRDQSNVRQGVPSPAQPTTPPATASRPTNTVASLKLQNIGRLQTDLAALAGRADVSPEVKQRLARNLLAAARGPAKPDGQTVARFVDELAAVLAGANLESAERARLAQDLNAAFDCADLPAERVQAILADVQAILQVSGVRRQDAVNVVNTLRLAAAEIQQPATR